MKDFETSWRKVAGDFRRKRSPMFLWLDTKTLRKRFTLQFISIPSLKTNISRENRPLEGRRFLLETIIFRCEVLVSGREDVCWAIWVFVEPLRLFFGPGFDVTKVSLKFLVLREIAKSSVQTQAGRWSQAVLAQNRSQGFVSQKISVMFDVCSFFSKKKQKLYFLEKQNRKLWKDFYFSLSFSGPQKVV